MKQNHNNKLFFLKIFLFSLAFCFTKISIVFAAEAKTIPDVIKNIFQWGIGISSVLTGIFFAVGAVQFIISGSNPTTKKDGKDRMISATLGLILLFASYAILNSINTKIIGANPNQFPADFGIFYTNGNPRENKVAPLQEANTSAIKKLGYKKITYKCPGIENGDVAGTPIMVWFYPKVNFEDSDPNFANVEVLEYVCGETFDIKSPSFKISFLQPAVYLYTEKGCKGFVSDPYTGDSKIPEPFSRMAKSARIVHSYRGANYDKETMVIFHENEDPNGSGQCSAPLYSNYKGESAFYSDCVEVNIEAKSLTIFKLSRENNRNTQGIKLYSKPWGWEPGSFAGFNDQTIKTNDSRIIELEPNDIKFLYTPCSGKYSEQGTTIASSVNNAKNAQHNCEIPEYKKICKTFADCPGSVQVIGKYLVVFYDSKPENLKDDQKFKGTCQVFRSNINSIKEKEFTALGGNIQYLLAFPIQ
jgi:hypothetical protein